MARDISEIKLLTPLEVGRLLRLDPKSVIRYARTGKLPSVRLPSGHHRFHEADVLALLDSKGGE